MHGCFVVHKPAGMTSSDCVTQIKWALVNNLYTAKTIAGEKVKNKKIRIGHGGTLDPFATGVLIVLFGEATKLADTYLHSKKAYTGIITLGTRTDTADLTGQIVETLPVPELSESDWQALASSFVGVEYLQIPPMYSAKKKDGVALHELARKGVEIERIAILKQIYKFEVKKLSPTELSFLVECESGTYVRTLAEDLAKKASTVAHLKTLCRSKSSDGLLEDSAPLQSILESLEKKTTLKEIQSYRPLSRVSSHIAKTTISDEVAASLRHGKIREIENLCVAVQENFKDQKYVIATSGARSEQGEELLALLSQTSPAHAASRPEFRVQCVFNGVGL